RRRIVCGLERDLTAAETPAPQIATAETSIRRTRREKAINAERRTGSSLPISGDGIPDGLETRAGGVLVRNPPPIDDRVETVAERGSASVCRVVCNGRSAGSETDLIHNRYVPAVEPEYTIRRADFRDRPVGRQLGTSTSSGLAINDPGGTDEQSYGAAPH